MGRYYSGDIEGKFWFGVQSSDDADFFGNGQQEPGYIPYYFDEEMLPDIEDGLKRCKKELKGYKTKLDKFFEEHNGYNDKMLVDAGFPEDKIRTLLVWYAREILGKKIYDCVKEHGECNFDAEL